MDAFRILQHRLRSLFRKDKLDLDLDDELRAHIELATEANLASGMDPKSARRAALRSFGGITQTKESYRAQRGLPMLETIAADLRYALRQLRKSPGFTAIVILTLGLGVGSVIAVYSVVSAVLLAPYNFRDPGQLVVWRETVQEMAHSLPVLPDNYRHYLNLKAHASSIEDAAIFQNPVFPVSNSNDAKAASEDLAHPQMKEGLTVSPNFFSVLGVTPLLGRTFTQEEAQQGKDKEIILTWGAWQRYFHGDPQALGKTLRIRGVEETVVGILPRSFRFPAVSMMPEEVTGGRTDRYELFEPLAPSQEEMEANDSEFNYLVIARLKSGVSLQQAQTELDGIAKATAAADHLPLHVGVIVEPLAEEVSGQVRKPLWMLLGAVLSVLLIGCLNLANLQIARGFAREHEMALRSALGAGRSRLVQGALAENLILGIAGGLAATAFAIAAVRLLLLTAASLPRMNEVALSLPVLALSLAFSLATSLGFGILPALRSMRAKPQGALQAGTSRVSGNRNIMRSRRILVAAEVACSVALLIVTALITRSFSHVLSQDRNFNAQQMTMARTDLSNPRYSSGDTMPDDPKTGPGADPGSLARDAMIDHTLDRLRALPGVDAAAVMSVLPLTGSMSVDTLDRPDHPLPHGQQPMADRRFIGPGFFAAMQIPLLAGPDFSQQDRRQQDGSQLRVIILSGKAAKSAFGTENPLGRTLRHWGRIYTIIGIAADARLNDLRTDAPLYYLPYWDFPPSNPVFLVRGSQGIETMGPAMRKAIWDVDPEVAIPTVISLDAQLAESVATQRFQAILLSSFGAAALLLAALGIYGVLAYSVSLRTQEFGIRIALGSSRVSLGKLVLIDAAKPVGIGMLLGLLAAAAGVRTIRSMLYQTSVVDPLSIALSLAVLIAAALLAGILPLRRAAFVDPMTALRAE
jgi:predicted permease